MSASKQLQHYYWWPVFVVYVLVVFERSCDSSSHLWNVHGHSSEVSKESNAYSFSYDNKGSWSSGVWLFEGFVVKNFPVENTRWHFWKWLCTVRMNVFLKDNDLETPLQIKRLKKKDFACLVKLSRVVRLFLLFIFETFMVIKVRSRRSQYTWALLNQD